MTTLPSLTPEHAQYLTENAVDPEFAAKLGVRSITRVQDLPLGFTYLQQAGVPAILFPWTDPTGRDEPQLKVMDGSKGYKFRTKEAGYQAPLWLVRRGRDDAGPVLLVEGAKQCLVAGQHAPEGYTVLGLSGCNGWICDGDPTPHLEIVEDRDVVVLFDADRLTNRNVFDAGVRLDRELRAEGATSVTFVDLPGAGKDGLDDYLVRKSPERRAKTLQRLLGTAAKLRLSDRPKAKEEKQEATLAEGDTRQPLDVDGDRRYVISAITHAMRDRWNGTRLFSYGGALAKIDEGKTVTIGRDKITNLIADCVVCVSYDQRGRASFTWPDTNTITSVLDRQAEFVPLSGIRHAPFVRPDGSICTTPGYDVATGAFLVLADGLGAISISENPSTGSVAAARSILLDEWLGDMPFPDDASRANALALALTPLIRPLVPVVPLAVVDGKMQGSGKNLLADCVAILATGQPAAPKPYSGDEENRKVITSSFRAGQDLFVFDEAHEIQGPHLARALTSLTYEDRQLSVSVMLQYPNNVTWMALGNQVRVNGDLVRRAYRIALHPTVDVPYDRPESDFRHPDLRAWTTANRTMLLTAALTLVRAWFAAGCPRSSRATGFGSFERWEQTIGGILANAGVEGFLGNTTTWRLSMDNDAAYWAAHLRWVHERFGEKEFTTREVAEKLKAGKFARDGEDVEYPPGLSDAGADGFSRELGKRYGMFKEVPFGSYRLLKSEVGARGSASRWSIKVTGADTDKPIKDPTTNGSWEGWEGSEGSNNPTSTRNNPSTGDPRTHVSRKGEVVQASLRSLPSLPTTSQPVQAPPDPSLSWLAVPAAPTPTPEDGCADCTRWAASKHPGGVTTCPRHRINGKAVAPPPATADDVETARLAAMAACRANPLGRCTIAPCSLHSKTAWRRAHSN